MKRGNWKKLVFILALLGLIPASGWASTESYGERKPPEPPQQAIDACQGQSEGTAVEMTTPRGDSMKAICKQMGTRLVAVPEGAPPSGKGGPPDGDRPAGGPPGGDPSTGERPQADPPKGGE